MVLKLMGTLVAGDQPLQRYSFLRSSQLLLARVCAALSCCRRHLSESNHDALAHNNSLQCPDFGLFAVKCASLRQRSLYRTLQMIILYFSVFAAGHI